MTTEATPAATPEVQPTAPSATPAPAATQPAAPERPSWLPPKFQSPEALATAYAELEKRLGQGQQPPATPGNTPPANVQPPAPSPAPTPEEQAQLAQLPDPATLNEADASFVLAQKGINAQVIADEYLEQGRLSDATYKKLQEGGFPRAFVDSWIAGREAIAEQHRTRLYGEVGGEKEFNGVLEWAKANLPEAALRAYNTAVSHGDIEVMSLAMRGLHARYVADNGRRPQLLGGDSGGSATDGFASQQEAIAAMRDPRYSRDPAYRAEVEQKLALKPVFSARVTK